MSVSQAADLSSIGVAIELSNDFNTHRQRMEPIVLEDDDEAARL